MEIIWLSNTSVSVKNVYEKIRKKRKIAYTTIMTIMSRLTTKGLLKRKCGGKAYLYEQNYSKDKFLANASQQIIRNFVSSFGDGAVAHFAQEIEKIPKEKRKKLLEKLKDSK